MQEQFVSSIKILETVLLRLKNACYANTEQDETESNAINVWLYFHAFLNYYKQNKDLVSDTEWNLLYETIETLSATHSLLLDLVLQLITLYDVLSVHSPHAERAQRLFKLLNKLPDFVLDKININLRTPIQKGEIALFSTQLLKNEIMSDEDVISAFEIKVNNKYAPDVIGSVKNLLRRASSLISDEEQNNLFLLVINSFGFGLFDEKELTLLIRNLVVQARDKESFVKQLLISYQNAYDRFSIELIGKSFLLRGVAFLFPVLDEQLSLGRLQELILETKFELKNPNHGLHRFQYDYYHFISMVYKGDIDTIERLAFTRALLPGTIQILSRNLIADSKLLKSDPLQHLPLLLRLRLLEQNLLVQHEFTQFVALFLRVNKNAPAYQQRNPMLFFIKYHHVMMQLIEVMGVEGILYMRQHLAGTVLYLERSLKSIPVHSERTVRPLADYFASLKLRVKEHPEQIKAFKTCIIILATLIDVDSNASNPQDCQSMYLEQSKGKMPQEFLLALTGILLQKIMCDEQSLLEPSEISNLFERIEPIQCAQLVVASKFMLEKSYREVYLNLLRLDFTSGDVADFLHNTQQRNEIGRSLAQHNQSIRTNLLAQGISPVTALQYDKKLEFVVLPENFSQITQANQLLRLWSYLKQIGTEAQRLIASYPNHFSADKNRIMAIQRCINELQQMLQSAESLDLVNVLKKKTAQALINKVIRNIEALFDHNANTSDSFKQCTREIRAIDQDARQHNEVEFENKIVMHHFSVEQWQKEKGMTFFLGDAVGCCLATNDKQFNAMVQRRMDDAMLFHVVVDKSTGRPVSLVWLYLAKTTDNKIVLIANFFETGAKFESNEPVRLALLNGLLQFTQRYCDDNPGIDAFYMQPMGYGCHNEDLNEYPLDYRVLLDKVGGPYIPGSESSEVNNDASQALTQDKYYLTSLSKIQFHLFEPHILAASQATKPNVVSKELLLQRAVLALSEYKTIEKVKQAVIDRHRLELSPFYEEALEQDAGFAQEIADILLRQSVPNPHLFFRKIKIGSEDVHLKLALQS